jgi:DNA-binding XRE family transcriptional regulator
VDILDKQQFVDYNKTKRMIFMLADTLKFLVARSGKTQKEIAKEIGLSPS